MRRSVHRNQVAAILLALVAWAVLGDLRLWSLVACYLGALLAIEGARRLGAAAPTVGPFAAAVVALAPAALVWQGRGELLEREGLRGADHELGDRLRLERTPSLAPPVLFADRPQELYAYAPGEEALEATLLGGALPGVALGHGLFRLRYDPRENGRPERSGPVEVALRTSRGPASRTLEAVVPLAHPRVPCADAERGLAAIPSEETDELIVVDRGGLRARLPVGDGPTACAVVGDAVLVAHRFEPTAWLVPWAGGAPRRIAVGSQQVHASARGDRIAIALRGPRGRVRVIDGASGHLETLEAGEEVDRVVFGPDPDTIVLSRPRAAHLDRFRRGPAGWARDATLPLGRPAVTLTSDADGARVWAAVTDYRPSGAPREANHFIEDQLLAIDVGSFEVIGRYPTARRGDAQDAPGGLDSGVSPVDVRALPAGDLLIAFAGTDEVWRFAPSRGEIVERIDTAAVDAPRPVGVADLGEGVTLVTSPSRGRVALVAGGALVGVADVAPADAELAGRDPSALRRRRGEQVFYEGTRSGVSCHSCHTHGDTDHVRHDIGQTTLLYTLSTRGVAGTAPYLRDASNPRLQDLIELSRTHLRGFRQARPGRADDLAAFVEALPGHPAPGLLDGRDVDLERRGVDAFFRARCDLCHAPPAFTNLGRLPSRTLFPDHEVSARQILDTPSLIGLHGSAPFLHDGRAATVAEVLEEHDDAGRHGHRAALSDEALADLVAFLERL